MLLNNANKTKLNEKNPQVEIEEESRKGSMNS